jgi:membrane dipeptidase
MWIDCHADTLLKKWLEEHRMRMVSAEFTGEFRDEYHATTDLLLAGGIDVQVTATWAPVGFETSGLEIVLEKFGILHAEVQNNPNVFQIKHKSDFAKVQDKNKLGYIFAIEGAVPLGNNLKLLPALYELGVRVITLVWSRKNMFAEGVYLPGFGASGISASEAQKGDDLERGEGLSELGKQLVVMMNELGIVIDASHLNRKGFQDVAKYSKAPFIASHSCAFSLNNHQRNLSDKQIKQIAAAGGCIGINFSQEFLVADPKNEPATIDDVVEHMVYIAELVGVDYVSLGSDFDGIDQGPVGLENAKKFKDIPPRLKDKGYSNKDIDKFMGENWHRVFREIWIS